MKPPKFHRMFDYRKTLLPNEYLASMEEGVEDISSATLKTGYSVGYPGWNLLYYVALTSIDREGDNVFIETGSNHGFSSIVLAQAIKDSGCKGHLYTVELDPINHAKALKNVSNAGAAEYVSLFLGDSIAFLREFVEQHDAIRFAFLDSCHDMEHAVKEFEAIYPRLKDESIVFFDNTYKIAEEKEDQKVNGALKVIKERFGGNLVNLPNTSWYTPGQAIWQRNGFAKDW